MAVFEYKGINSRGKETKGVIDAENLQIARQKLKTQQIYVSHLKERLINTANEAGTYSSTKWFERITHEDITIMTRQLATLIAAHIPIVDALTALTDQVEKEKLKTILSQVKQQVNEGNTLAKALEKFPKYFSELFINMVAAGEASGALDIVLLRLADFMEYQNMIRQRVFSALAYPILMLIVGTIALTVIFVVVIPRIRSVFDQLGASLPLPTTILIWISEFIQNYWYVILLAIAAIIWGIRRYIRTPKGKRVYHRFKLNAPLFGPIVRMVDVSRFAKTLSILLSSGIPLLSALKVVKNVMTNMILREAIEFAQQELTDGKGFSGPLARSRQFPPMLTHMITIGEQTGELENMLNKVSDHYTTQVSTKINTLTALLGPLLIVLMAGAVAFIVISVILPFFEINSAL